VLDELGHWARLAGRKGRRAALLVDDRLPPETVDRARGSLAAAGLDVSAVPVHASEPDKSLAQIERVLRALADAALERGEVVVALGGGIVGDLAGFAAAVYRRGVAVVQCPTTLLSMVDASVGGKTGVNLQARSGLLKNFVGSFHQPRAVLADVSTLASLPRREFISGLAECVKHGMLSGGFGDAGLLDWTAAEADRILAKDPGVLTSLVARNVAVKAEVVAGDEREELPSSAGGRALLNLGHTFGHAVETLPGVSPDGDPSHAPLMHGEAVALGLVAAAAVSVRLGHLNAGQGREVADLLRRLGLPTSAAGLPPAAEVLERMGHDKKTAGGVIRLIVPEAGRRCRVLESPERQAVEAGIAAMSGR
jgi:3-dehydroquinate synthetase